MLHTLGDPTQGLLSVEATEEQRTAVREMLGLNDPIPVQYARFLGQLARGDLGTSFVTKEPVLKMVQRAFPNTLLIALLAVTLGLIVAIPLGSFAAYRRSKNQKSIVDKAVLAFISFGQSMPSFYIGMLLIFGFAVTLRVLPVSGVGAPQNYVLPVLTITLSSLAIQSQVTRTQMLQQLNFDYARTARAKGLSEVVVVGHVLRNVLIPTITIAGLNFGGLLGGLIITEQIFAVPGIGSLMLYGVSSSDHAVVLGVLVVTATLNIAINFIVDMLYFVVDPRIKKG